MAEVKPNTQYQWKEDEVFTFTGKEYEMIINTVNALLSTQEAQKILLLSKVNDVLHTKLVKAIEEDRAFEAAIPPNVVPPLNVVP